MSYSEAFTHNVLADLLHRQPIRDTDPAIAPARLRQALTTGPTLDQGEARLLWTSQTALEEYLVIREEIQLELAERCRQRGLTLSLQPVSAAFAPGQTHHLHADAVTVWFPAEQEAGGELFSQKIGVWAFKPGIAGASAGSACAGKPEIQDTDSSPPEANLSTEVDHRRPTAADAAP